MEITNRETQQNIDVLAGEIVKLDISGVKTFEQTVQAGYIGKITFLYQEIKIIP